MPPTPPLSHHDSGCPQLGDQPRLDIPRGAAVGVFGRHVAVAAEAGGWSVRSGAVRLIAAGAVAGTRPGDAWIGPGVAGRELVAPGGATAECWWAGLDLPAAIWEVTGQGTLEVEWEVPMAPPETFALQDDATHLRTGSAEFFARDGALVLTPGGSAVRVICRGPAPLRIMVTGGAEAARARSQRAFERGPAALAEPWRQQVRSATRLETPEPSVDLAFTWAWRRLALPARVAGSASPAREATLTDAATRFLSDPADPNPGSAEGVVQGVLGGLWGVTPHPAAEAVTVEPELPAAWPGMALRRLRVGRTLLDVELRRRHGQLVARVYRRFGPRVLVTLAPRGAHFDTASVDEVELLGGRARFEAADRHEIIFQ